MMSFRGKPSDICSLFIINSWIFTYYISRLVWNSNYCFIKHLGEMLLFGYIVLVKSIPENIPELNDTQVVE